MNRYQKFEWNEFNDWRNKVKEHLPKLIIEFYQSDKKHDYEIHVYLGRIIEKINNPFYGIQDEKGNRLNELEIISSTVALKMIVNIFLKYMNKSLER